MGNILSFEGYSNILRVCASQPIVKNEVLKNHDDNLWWPLSVEDWRIRMLVAGLSTRISYNMIKTYQEVVQNINSIPFSAFISLSEGQLRGIIKPLGLNDLRYKFFCSMIDFCVDLDRQEKDVLLLSNDELINQIRQKVFGASFKVAQCCALYAKGYYCGIMPVDSGMAEMLCPSLGLPAPEPPLGNEIIRLQLESLTAEIDSKKIAYETGYSSLNFPPNKPLTWWAHLVLIYYKRFFSRKTDPAGLPLRSNRLTENLVTQLDSQNKIVKLGGIKNIIIEGMDGVGKSTLAKLLTQIGFKTKHSDYHISVDNLFDLYDNLLDETSTSTKRNVFDRFFMSEMVYGKILRRKSRLNGIEVDLLFKKLKDQGSMLIYLYAPLDILLKRIQPEDSLNIKSNYLSFQNEYHEMLNLASQYLPIIRINTKENNMSQVFKQLMGFEPDLLK